MLLVNRLIGDRARGRGVRAVPAQILITCDMAFHEKAGRSQAESLSVLIQKQGFSPPS